MRKTSNFFLGTIGIAVIFVLIILGILDQPINFFRKTLITVYRPIYRFSTIANANLKNISRADKMSEMIAQLEAERADLMKQIVNQTILAEENAILKKALQFKSEKKINLIPAHVFIRLKEDNSNIVGLDVGSRGQVEKGDAVITENGVVIGKIWQVDNETSKVLLLTDGKSKIGADVIGVDNFGGIVEGQYGLGITLTTIPQDTEINPKTIVITSGLENKIPRGLLLGQVVEVIKEEREPFLKAILKNLISVDTVHTVFVVKK